MKKFLGIFFFSCPFIYFYIDTVIEYGSSFAIEIFIQCISATMGIFVCCFIGMYFFGAFDDKKNDLPKMRGPHPQPGNRIMRILYGRTGR